MPPGLDAQSHPLAWLDLPALDRVIASVLLRLDLGSVAGTSDQPSQARPPASGRPVADNPTQYHPAMHQSPSPVAQPAPPPRILLVDDIPAMRIAVRGLLEDADLSVIGEAADGLQAVAMAAELQPDVVVMDVRMPGLDGLQATRQITDAHPHIRVVVYSVFDSDETQQAARHAGAAAFVAKGSPPDQLPATLLATWQTASRTPTSPGAPAGEHPR
jgi:CheY-like chemotaxis protein